MGKLKKADFLERRVLPLVLAFAAGVMVTFHSAKAQQLEDHRALMKTETELLMVRMACGLESQLQMSWLNDMEGE